MTIELNDSTRIEVRLVDEVYNVLRYSDALLSIEVDILINILRISIKNNNEYIIDYLAKYKTKTNQFKCLIKLVILTEI